jgi:hypothetical protein
MTIQSFYQILSKHFQKDNVSNFHGIKIYPELVNDKISLSYSNPKDLSFNYARLVDHFYENCEMLLKLLGNPIEHNSDNFEWYGDMGTRNHIYLSDSGYEELKKRYESVKKFRLKISENIIINAELDLIRFEKPNMLRGDEGINIGGVYFLYNISNEPNTRQFSLDSNLGYIHNWYSDDYNNFEGVSYDTLSPVVDFIMDNPLMFNDSWMYVNSSFNPEALDDENNEYNFTF